MAALVSVDWSDEARRELRSIERENALQILHCLSRYIENLAGDVKKLHPPRKGFRLRCGDYRVFFDMLNRERIGITSVRHRRQAYR